MERQIAKGLSRRVIPFAALGEGFKLSRVILPGFVHGRKQSLKRGTVTNYQVLFKTNGLVGVTVP